MENLKLNETPVRTAKNFRINNIKLENIEITDDEIEAEIQRLAESWNMEADKVRSYMDVDLMRNDMSAQKALEMITDAAVEK